MVQTDRDALLMAMKYLRRPLATPPLADHVIRENFPGPDAQTDEQLMAHARATGSTTYHPAGTCKIGTDPMAVVDPQSMKVIGLSGLRVADASCMPRMVSGNTYAATNVIAEKAADLIQGPDPGDLTSVPRHQGPHRVEHAQAAAMQQRQPSAITQHLDLQDLLELRRQLLRLEDRQQPDRLVGVVKLGRHPRFIHAQTEKIGQYGTRIDWGLLWAPFARINRRDGSCLT